MAVKKYSTQTSAIINGKQNNTTIFQEGGDNDVKALASLYAGAYSTKEVNESLSDSTNESKNYSDTFEVRKITLVGPKKQYSTIKAFRGNMHFKPGTTSQDIKNALKDCKPFELLPTEKPLRILVDVQDAYDAEEATTTPTA